MSNSSTPEPAPLIDVAEIEEAEQEVGAQRERALGVRQAGGRGRGGGWITLAWGLPGFVWLGFFLVAPLVFIVLVSFWTRTDTGFVKTWTLHNYGTLLHLFDLSNSYWSNMLKSFETS